MIDVTISNATARTAFDALYCSLGTDSDAFSDNAHDIAEQDDPDMLPFYQQCIEKAAAVKELYEALNPRPVPISQYLMDKQYWIDKQTAVFGQGDWA